ncbi:MAG: hypothetical protein AB7P49_12335 [Bdellovibrionales bacterium]
MNPCRGLISGPPESRVISLSMVGFASIDDHGWHLESLPLQLPWPES